jgi:hypothetical protein
MGLTANVLGDSDRRYYSGEGDLRIFAPKPPFFAGATMTFWTFVIASTSACLMSLAPSAWATVMFDPASVSTDMGTFSGNINNVINQSGQNPTYISDVTDFAVYTSSAKANPGVASNLWTSAGGATTGNVDFNLGGSVEIDAFAIWALISTNGDNIGNFTLLASNDASFTTTTMLGNFTPTHLADLRTLPMPRADHAPLGKRAESGVKDTYRQPEWPLSS